MLTIRSSRQPVHPGVLMPCCAVADGMGIRTGDNWPVFRWRSLAVDVHYRSPKARQAAAVVATDAAFSRLVADRVEVVPAARIYRSARSSCGTPSIA